MSISTSPDGRAGSSTSVPGRAQLITDLLHEVDEQMALEESCRGAARVVCTSKGLPLLTVRRLTRDHPAAPWP
jgi:hypothetical protein